MIKTKIQLFGTVFNSKLIRYGESLYILKLLFANCKNEYLNLEYCPHNGLYSNKSLFKLASFHSHSFLDHVLRVHRFETKAQKHLNLL